MGTWLLSCGGSSPTSPAGSSLAPGPLSFSVSPIDPALLQFIVPLGNMGPWAHTLPTDHIYFYHHLGAGGFAPVPIVAPAAGTVEFALPPNAAGEQKIGIRVNRTFLYYFDHVNLAPGVGAGATIRAGAAIGTSAGIAFDFNVTNSSIVLGFVNPVRYGGTSGLTLGTDAPLKYFVEPIKSQLYAKVQRDAPDLDGRINYDVDGTLAGNWFAEDLPPAASMSGDISTGGKQLAFARDVWHPDRLRISIGGLGMTGLYGVPPETADFPGVTPSTELVVYRLLNTGEPGGAPGITQLGLLLVQMLDASRLRVEAMPEPLARTATFSANAQVYVR
jgi:hypothetical protein